MTITCDQHDNVLILYQGQGPSCGMRLGLENKMVVCKDCVLSRQLRKIEVEKDLLCIKDSSTV